MPTLRHIRFAAGADERRSGGWTMAGLVDAEPTAVDPAVLAAAEAEVTPADRMVIVHTSGSTSEPKGVIHTHGALIRHLDNLNQLRRYTPDEVLFSNSPFFWIGGFAYALLGTLVAGARLVCSNAPTPPACSTCSNASVPPWSTASRQSVAHLPDDPSFAGRDLSSIRRGNLWPIMPADVEAGRPRAAPLDAGDDRGRQRLPGVRGRVRPARAPAWLVRSPAPGLEARVVDPETGSDVRTGAGRRAVAAGPVHDGGLLRARARRGVHPRRAGTAPETWCRSTRDGFFYFKGRHSDMIKTGGANVSPARWRRPSPRWPGCGPT